MKDQGASTLHGLYAARRQALFDALQGCKPAESVARVKAFLRELERPYLDASGVSGTIARLVPHVLGVATEAIGALASVKAVVEANPARPVRSETSPGVRYLWAVAALSIAAFVIVLLIDEVLAGVIALVLIGLIATAGAAAANSSAKGQRATEGAVPTPDLAYHVDLGQLDGRLSEALRAADDLLAVGAAPPSGSHSEVSLDEERVVGLLQALAALHIAPDPETSPRSLANEAIHVLRAARLSVVAYDDAHADFFEQRPGGVPEPQTVLPAVLDEHGRAIRAGTVLMPI